MSRAHDARDRSVELRALGEAALDDEMALSLADPSLAAPLESLTIAARAVADRAFGRRVTFSPKVFLPVTNLCRNRCGYCSFRKSPSQTGVWTMSPTELTDWIARGREQGCIEALLCLGDKPETSFPSYRRQLAEWGHDDTVDYLARASRLALDHGLLPHTNAGLLSISDMERLRPLNVSLGLMLESASARLCGPGMPHHRAPDKVPAKRLAMIGEAGALKIPFTTGVLIGIGESRLERIEALLEIRRLHRLHGHIQEVIVQAFRARPDIPMHAASEATDDELCDAIALARLILDDEVTVQAPPNLSPASTARLLSAGINDFGGISPVTPDYINPRHPWPHLDALADTCAKSGFMLRARLPIHDRWRKRPEFLDAGLEDATRQCEARMRSPGIAPRLAAHDAEVACAT
ncbi:MAG: 7,8-didemethyl-8-hydroxy-5-deazariboflavin synthase CofG [Polyangiales bacterium]